MQQLANEGMCDVYRNMHASVAGYTHFTRGVDGAEVKSRLDHIWCGGMQMADIESCEVDTRLLVSHHRVLWCQVKSAVDLHVHAGRETLRLPNLRRASDEQMAAMAADLGARVDNIRDEIVAWSAG